MDKEQEKWAIFWCDLLKALIYNEIDAEATNRFLKELAEKASLFSRRTYRETLAFRP
jgi:putative transposase